MPPELRALLDKFLSDIAYESNGIGSGHTTVDQWQIAMANDLLIYHQAAYMAGKGERNLSLKERASVNEQVGAQLDYLNAYAEELDQRGWQDRDVARAALYAGSIKPTFWRGKTYGYDLPAYPGDGSTPCLVNCGCFWEMNELDPEELSADFTWHLGASEHCPSCLDRSLKWSPLKFRGGEMV